MQSSIKNIFDFVLLLQLLLL